MILWWSGTCRCYLEYSRPRDPTSTASSRACASHLSLNGPELWTTLQSEGAMASNAVAAVKALDPDAKVSYSFDTARKCTLSVKWATSNTKTLQDAVDAAVGSGKVVVA